MCCQALAVVVGRANDEVGLSEVSSHHHRGAASSSHSKFHCHNAQTRRQSRTETAFDRRTDKLTALPPLTSVHRRFNLACLHQSSSSVLIAPESVLPKLAMPCCLALHQEALPRSCLLQEEPPARAANKQLLRSRQASS